MRLRGSEVPDDFFLLYPLEEELDLLLEFVFLITVVTLGRG